MESIDVEISLQVVRIKCSKCGNIFLKTFDELKVAGIITCPNCKHDHFLMKVKK